MDQNPKKDHLARGVVKLAGCTGNFDIAYGEDESRDGRLRVNVDGKSLRSTELLALAERLQLEEKKLADGRRRYKEMAMQYLFLQRPDPENDGNAPGWGDS
jgi:hypothetical protein